MGHRYIGSKSKIIDIITGKISKLVPKNSTVCDLMTGTGTVAIELANQGFNVIANDLMTYSYHHAITGLKFDAEPTFSLAGTLFQTEQLTVSNTPYQAVIDYLNESPVEKGYFWREFSVEGKPNHTEKPRNYFTPENAMKIDGIRKRIEYLLANHFINNQEYSLLLHSLIMAANDVANIAGTYGHYMSKTVKRAEAPITLECEDIIIRSNSSAHIVKQGYAEQVSSEITCDLCYIDPPYMKRQYAANYHILETLARGDEPEAIGVSGLRPWRDQYSNFCTKTKIRDSFRKIIGSINCNKFLISYSEDGLLSVKDFKELLEPLGELTIETFEHKRFKSNNSKLNNTLAEYLILLRT